jgi:hypothetical protein
LAIFLAWVLSCEINKSPRHNECAAATTADPSRAKEKGKEAGRGGLETLFRGVKTRNVVENKGRAIGRAKQRPDMCMKTKDRTAQSRYVIENKSG